MIVGRKVSTAAADQNRILADIAGLKKLYGIEKHYLETLLDI